MKIARAIGIGILAANMVPSATLYDHTLPLRLVPTPHFAKHHPCDAFLEKIAQLESSGGKNTDHQTMKRGLHRGTTAMGRYGLMPNTILLVAKKSKDPFLKALSALPPAEVATYLSQVQGLEREVARIYAQTLRRRFRGDQVKMAYSWRLGPNREMADAPSHPYVLAFLGAK